MAIDTAISDTARGIQHDPDQSWPSSVTVQLVWKVGEEHRYRTIDISADQFFGHGAYGAPMEGVALTSMIENLRRLGPPMAMPKKRIRDAKTNRPRRQG